VLLALQQGSLVFLRLGKYLESSGLCENLVVPAPHSFTQSYHLEMPDLWLCLTDDGLIFRADPSKLTLEAYPLSSVPGKITLFL
jgi:hypothetical protein